MVGNKYWATGIIIDWMPSDSGKSWNVKIEFFDNGFCENKSTEGHLKSRYFESDLSALIDTIKLDAEGLGIEFKEPKIYMAGDGEIEGKEYPTEWRKNCNDQAERMGWKRLYTDNHIIIDAVKDKEKVS